MTKGHVVLIANTVQPPIVTQSLVVLATCEDLRRTLVPDVPGQSLRIHDIDDHHVVYSRVRNTYESVHVQLLDGTPAINQPHATYLTRQPTSFAVTGQTFQTDRHAVLLYGPHGIEDGQVVLFETAEPTTFQYVRSHGDRPLVPSQFHATRWGRPLSDPGADVVDVLTGTSVQLASGQWQEVW